MSGCDIDDIYFNSLNVMCLQLAGASISKEMTDLRECILYPFWQ
jgi:hypothetical protein